MMKALWIIGGTIVAFAAGMGLMYVAVPAFAPEVAEQARAQADSLAARALAAADSAALAAAVPDSSTLVLPDSLAPARPDTLVAALRDSLDAARQTLDTLRTENTTLAAAIADLRAMQEAAEARRVEAAALGATLTRLEDKELKEVLAQLDLAVLEQLFAEASGRNRTRLLQALPPASTAQFVRRLMEDPGAEVPAEPVRSDTALAAPTMPAPTASANE